MQMAMEARPVRILLVEDNPGDVDLTLEAFRAVEVPHELSHTWNGEAALAYLRGEGEYTWATRPDMILLDLNLPRKDGREVLAEIKQDPELCEIPVIVLTTSHAERDIQEAYRLHANSYIVKPVELEEFFSAVRLVEQYWLSLTALPSGWKPWGPAEAAAEPPVPPKPEPPAGPAVALPLPEGLTRVLLVEDHPGDVELIQEYLAATESGLSVEVVASLSRARERLQTGGIDLVLLDLSLPDSMGLDTFSRVFEVIPDVPIVVLSGLADEAVATRAVQAGAQDYLVKGDVDERLILRTLRYAYERAHTQRQLRTAQKMEEIGRLAGGVAHDFNNMLGVILGYSDMLLAQAAPGSEAHTDLHEVKAAGQRAAALARQLLALGRRQMVSPRLLRLDELVRGIASMLQRLVPPEIELELQLGTAGGWLRADASQLEQALVNLVVNARDAISGAGRIRISTSVADVDEDEARQFPGITAGRFEVLSVSDTGTGIQEDVRPLVFEPFFTTKPAGQGSGLGLASVYGTMQQSGGFIRLESALGQGACFHLYFPSLEAPSSGETEQATILVVEADAQLRRLVAQILGAAGYILLLAADGREAVRLAQAHAGRLDLLLADLELFGDQQQALRRLWPELKVLYTSAYSAREAGSAPATGAAELVIRKPFSPAELAQRVAEILARPARD
jgi:CheY-like chemotaxis protein